MMNGIHPVPQCADRLKPGGLIPDDDIFIFVEDFDFHVDLWLQIIFRRRSKFSQPTPRGPASLRDIVAVGTKVKKEKQFSFFTFVQYS